MATKSILDIREDKIKIEGKAWDSDELRLLAMKQIFMFQKTVEYWRPLIERGRKYTNYYAGKILSSAQIAAYEVGEEKIVIQPPIMKAPIRALVGQALKSRKSGQIVSERTGEAAMEDNSKELDTLNVVMKDMEIKTSEEYKIKEAFKQAMISCYWNVIMFDKDRPSRNSNGMRYSMRNLPWASCVFGPMGIREPDGSDIKELFFFDYRSMADLIDNFPDMEKQILAHFHEGEHVDSQMLTSLREWGDGMTAEDRDTMYDIIDHATEAKRGSTGLAKVVMHLYPIKTNYEVWVNMFDATGEDFEIIPPEWDDERRDAWLQENSQKYAGPYEREAIILYCTVFTTSGLVLSNEAHWFQENGQLPCSFWVGDVDDGMPTGLAADMADNCLMNCVVQIEKLDVVRKQSGSLTLVKEGSITTMSTLGTEANKAFGVAMVSKDFNAPVSEAVHVINRQPSDAWRVFDGDNKSDMYENTRVNETMMGQPAPRQSAIAKEAEISQALTVNASYVDNLNRSWEYHQNLKLKIIPYVYDEHEVLEVKDEKTGTDMMVEVNAPESYDEEGNVASVINDLSAHRYRWKISAVDDSATAAIRNDEDALMVLNTAAGPLMQADTTGMTFATFLASQQNPRLRDTGRALLQQAQAAAQTMSEEESRKSAMEQVKVFAKAKADILRAQKSGVYMNFQAENMEDYPGLRELYLQLQQLFEQNTDESLAEIQALVAPAEQQAEAMPGQNQTEAPPQAAVA